MEYRIAVRCRSFGRANSALVSVRSLINTGSICAGEADRPTAATAIAIMNSLFIVISSYA